uniref:Membrane cofactor protein n=1 Tax=Molossus molossus TaxID=27622 RepID=A0A7J8CQA9_MOLMO|nr:CD46 molecule [Molossus molossus]
MTASGGARTTSPRCPENAHFDGFSAPVTRIVELPTDPRGLEPIKERAAFPPAPRLSTLGMAPPSRGRREVTPTCGYFVSLAIVASGVRTRKVLRLPTSLGDCRNPPFFESMTLKGTPKASYLPGERVYYECNKGYVYSYYYPLSTFCEQAGTWYPADEACYKKKCPTPKVPNGEVYDPQITFEFDKEAHFYCNYGYYLKGAQILTCQLSGDNVFWNYDIPTCEKILCKSPGKISNGKHTNNWRDVFEFNELVTYSCDPSNGPEEYSLVGESKLVCSGPGKWSSDPPQCKVVQCEPPVLKHGKAISEMKDKFSYKDEVKFECLKGFYLNGSNPVYCGGNNTWEPEMPTCIKGVKPTRATKPPLANYPDPGIIALIILTILVGIAVICTCVYKCLRRGKKG